jgi:hypothetical protein
MREGGSIENWRGDVVDARLGMSLGLFEKPIQLCDVGKDDV